MSLSHDIFQIAGDAPDPTGSDPRASGVLVTHDLTQNAIGHPVILVKVGDKYRLVTADVYALPGQPMYVHLICPMCAESGRQNALRIVEGHKKIAYEKAAPPTWPGWSRDRMREDIAATLGVAPADLPAHAGGTISIEAFSCTWEAETLPGREFQFSRCPWAVEIDHNVARSIR